MADQVKKPNVSLPPSVDTPEKPNLALLLEQCSRAAMTYKNSPALAQFLTGLADAQSALPIILEENNG